jgi:hypothetical protein
MATDYQYANYQQQLGDSAYNEFKHLERQFANAFGSNFGQFSYEAWLNDPEYAQRIQNQLGHGVNATDKQQAYQALQDFWQKQTQGSSVEQSIEDAGGPLDVQALFGPVKAGIGEYADQARQQGSADINRLSAGAERRAQEGLAGTGLGRSGAAAGGFAAIGNERTGAIERLLGQVNDYEMRAKSAVDQKVAELQHQDYWRKLGMTAEEIRSATQFQRSLYTMEFQSLLQADAEAQKDWWDSWGGVLTSSLGAIGGFAVGGPQGAAYGAYAGSQIGGG